MTALSPSGSSGGSERCSMRAAGGCPAQRLDAAEEADRDVPAQRGRGGQDGSQHRREAGAHVGVEVRRDHEADIDLLALHIPVQLGLVPHGHEGQVHGLTGLAGDDGR